MIGNPIFERIKTLPVEGVGGMTLGAEPIAVSVSLLSYLNKKNILAFVVRKEPEGDGIFKIIALLDQEKVAQIILLLQSLTLKACILLTISSKDSQNKISLPSKPFLIVVSKVPYLKSLKFNNP